MRCRGRLGVATAASALLLAACTTPTGTLEVRGAPTQPPPTPDHRTSAGPAATPPATPPTTAEETTTSGRDATPPSDGASAEPRDATADDERPALLESGDRGPAVRRLQERLHGLGYWLGPVDGVFGTLTEQAVFAFQGVEGLAIDGVVGPDTRTVLAGATRPAPRTDLVEGLEVHEEERAVFAVEDGRVRWIWHTSTGSYERYRLEGEARLADTPNGTHQISWQVDGWRRNELGRLYRPKYFHPDGIAIHGFGSVPAAPSSHGCVRVTMAAMDFIWAQGLAPEGSTVVVDGPQP